MITVSQLAQLDIDALETFADDWAAVHRKIKSARTEFHDDVVRALRRDHWRGQGGQAAQRHCERMVLDLDALDAEVRSLRSYMDVEADGKHGRGGLKGLKGHQRTVAELIQQALDAGMTVNDTGQVTWSEMRAPGPLSPAEKQHVEERDEKAAGLERKIEAELRAATETDAQLARDLKVIFGTPDNFETESRKHGIDDAGLHDWWVFKQLEAVESGMRTIEHWGHASELLFHYLHGDGTSYEVDPGTMLDDVPAFRHDVDHTLDGVREKPDGAFSTPWTSTAPKIKDGGGQHGLVLRPQPLPVPDGRREAERTHHLSRRGEEALRLGHTKRAPPQRLRRARPVRLRAGRHRPPQLHGTGTRLRRARPLPRDGREMTRRRRRPGTAPDRS